MTGTYILKVVGCVECINELMCAAVLFVEWLAKKEREFKIFENENKDEK